MTLDQLSTANACLGSEQQHQEKKKTMLKSVKTILFATNLTRSSVPAFEAAVVLALSFKAKIVVLHVLEKIPDYVEGRLAGMLGEDQWNQMMHAYQNEVRQSLTGKRSSSKLIRKALEHFCGEAGIDDATCGYQSREIVVTESGDVAERIIENAIKQDCDLIILGAHEGLFAKQSLGPTVKSVLKKSKIPVLVVPFVEGEEPSLPLVSGWRKE
jgi:nucleotide-binding universal stress UspA family protein